ncbi:MAG: CoA transferase, partial [Burkholderiales bacterium]|nr:CoA transferase [Burkholderiales bacterium]
MRGVLEGVKVLDLTQMVAGPLATLMLGDMGADVIKVEPPGGAAGREIGRNRPGGESDYYLSMNRNKRGIVLDLKTAAGIEAVKALAAASDILVENFRPGTMERLGLGYETLRAANPGLVYCAVSGFGSHGAYRDRPALDPVIQAMSGYMQLNGTPESGPLKSGALHSDFTAPLFATIGILAALRARDASGRGQRVEVSMMDATIFSMTPREQYYFATGSQPARTGNAHYQLAPYNTYATSDARHLMVLAHTDKYWRGLTRAIERDDLAADPRFATGATRFANRVALDAIIAAVIATRTLADWLERFGRADVLFAPVRDFDQVFSDPLVRETMV